MFFMPPNISIPTKSLATCKYCGEFETIERIDSDLVCNQCGRVNEEAMLLREDPTFDEDNKMHGQFIFDASLKYNTKGDYAAKRDAKIEMNIKNLERKFQYQSFVLSQLVIKMLKKIRPYAHHTKHLDYALLYRVCRNEMIPLSLFDLSLATSSQARGAKSIGRAYFRVEKILKGPDLRDDEEISEVVQLIDAESRIKCVVDKLALTNKYANVNNVESRVFKCALQIYKAMAYNLLTDGRDPQGVYGSCIYLALYLCDVPIDIETIADIVGMSSNTLKQRLYELARAPGSECCSIIEFLNYFTGDQVDVRLERSNLPPCMKKVMEKFPHDSDSESCDDDDDDYRNNYNLNYDDINISSIPDEVVNLYLNTEEEVREKTKIWEANFQSIYDIKQKEYRPKTGKMSSTEINYYKNNHNHPKITDFFKHQPKSKPEEFSSAITNTGVSHSQNNLDWWSSTNIMEISDIKPKFGSVDFQPWSPEPIETPSQKYTPNSSVESSEFSLSLTQ